MFLKISRLTKQFGEVKALNGIDLEIKKGEFVSIMGPSGSGKTTLLTLIGSLDNPSSGEIILEGESLSEIKDLDAFRSKKVGFVFQFHNLISYLTSLENVELVLHRGRSKSVSEETSMELLRLVGLEERLHHKPSQLSGGERQRVAVARALVNDPLMVLADEPTGELDSTTSVEIINLMKQINKQKGTTFIVVTHDPEIAKRGDKIIYLRDGKISREEIVISESVEDIICLKHSSFGHQILTQKLNDPYMEKLGLFRKGNLTKEGETFRSIFEKAEKLQKS
ncbi:MAG: ABC transporter ATP-binding protein [Theionarchaea archaeon]|nr:ABC transporter ATP-binding protein [Theionarchaea archaeon]